MHLTMNQRKHLHSKKTLRQQNLPLRHYNLICRAESPTHIPILYRLLFYVYRIDI